MRDKTIEDIENFCKFYLDTGLKESRIDINNILKISFTKEILYNAIKFDQFDIAEKLLEIISAIKSAENIYERSKEDTEHSNYFNLLNIAGFELRNNPYIIRYIIKNIRSSGIDDLVEKEIRSHNLNIQKKAVKHLTTRPSTDSLKIISEDEHDKNKKLFTYTAFPTISNINLKKKIEGPFYRPSIQPVKNNINKRTQGLFCRAFSRAIKEGDIYIIKIFIDLIPYTQIEKEVIIEIYKKKFTEIYNYGNIYKISEIIDIISDIDTKNQLIDYKERIIALNGINNANPNWKTTEEYLKSDISKAIRPESIISNFCVDSIGYIESSDNEEKLRIYILNIIFQDAAEHNNINIINKLALKYSKNKAFLDNIIKNHDNIAIKKAVIGGHIEIIKRLISLTLNKDEKIEIILNMKNSTLMTAIRYGSLEIAYVVESKIKNILLEENVSELYRYDAKNKTNTIKEFELYKNNPNLLIKFQQLVLKGWKEDCIIGARDFARKLSPLIQTARDVRKSICFRNVPDYLITDIIDFTGEHSNLNSAQKLLVYKIMKYDQARYGILNNNEQEKHKNNEKNYLIINIEPDNKELDSSEANYKIINIIKNNLYKGFISAYETSVKYIITPTISFIPVNIKNYFFGNKVQSLSSKASAVSFLERLRNEPDNESGKYRYNSR